MRTTEGLQYLIRVKKQADVLTDATPYLRRIFGNLRHTPIDDASAVLLNTPRYLLLITSPIHRADASRMFYGWDNPAVEVYPIVRDTTVGYPYRRIMCVRTYKYLTSASLPKETEAMAHYRWVVYERGREIDGILISEEPSIVPYPCEHSTEAFLITADQTELYFSDLAGYTCDFSLPLQPPAEQAYAVLAGNTEACVY
jgi:hypothetical protein